MADEIEEQADSTLTASEFHTIAQKQIMNAVFATLTESKMPWNLVEPFLQAARDVCAGDFAENGRISLHTMRAEGETWVEAEEAFLGIAVADRETGDDWLAETYWLSDVATAGADREDVLAVIAALGRTIAKLNVWLESGGSAPPAESPADP
jgi:hypothetical protein